jgi:hypothetical protein
VRSFGRGARVVRMMSLMWIVGDIAVGDKRVLPNISISIIAESPTNDNQSR